MFGSSNRERVGKDTSYNVEYRRLIYALATDFEEDGSVDNLGLRLVKGADTASLTL